MVKSPCALNHNIYKNSRFYDLNHQVTQIAARFTGRDFSKALKVHSKPLDASQKYSNTFGKLYLKNQQDLKINPKKPTLRDIAHEAAQRYHHKSPKNALYGQSRPENEIIFPLPINKNHILSFMADSEDWHKAKDIMPFILAFKPSSTKLPQLKLTSREELYDLLNTHLMTSDDRAIDLFTSTKLDVSDAGLVPEDILMISKYFPNLEYLDLTDNHIGSEGAQYLKNLTKLKSLYLHGTKVNDVGVKALSTLVNLENLNLGWNNIGPEGMKPLEGLVKLKSLNLGFNNIGLSGAKTLQKFENLESLDLGWNNISSKGLKYVSTLKKLKALYLHETNICSDGAQYLAALKKLTYLDVANNAITSEGLQYFKDLHALEYLDISFNEIDTESIKCLKNLKRLECLKHIETDTTKPDGHNTKKPPLQIRLKKHLKSLMAYFRTPDTIKRHPMTPIQAVSIQIQWFLRVCGLNRTSGKF